jgi:ribosomal protein S18 acetylase RimI-like enzyme
MNVTIRRAEARDVPQMLALVKELALFEKEPEAVTVTEAEMRDAGFGEKPVWFGWVAEVSAGSEQWAVGGKSPGIVGMAVCYTRYSTWRGRTLYLEDIIVTDAARGQRIGERLFHACVQHAVANDHAWMRWQVLDWNTGAIRFYERFGASISPGWLNGELTREQLLHIAATAV